MKRTIFLLFALVAMATGLQAQTNYGFSILSVPITSNNYQSESSGKAWYYDPETNVLHLTDGTIWSATSSNRILEIDGNVNSSLTIQVDGTCNFGGTFDLGLYFTGNGKHTICGNGTLKICSDKTNAQAITGALGKVDLTIKDVTINIESYGPTGIGFLNTGFGKIVLNYCEMNIKTSYGAWKVIGTNHAKPDMVDCFLSNGYFDVKGGAYDYNDNDLTEVYIKRCIKEIDLSIDSPAIGKTLSTTVTTAGDDYEATSVQWEFITGHASDLYPDGFTVSEENICQQGETYSVVIELRPKEGANFSIENITAKVNGEEAMIFQPFTSKRVTIRYTFPRLETEKYYDLWIAGNRVSNMNIKNITEMIAKWSDEAMERYLNGDMNITFDGQTLTLQNVIIKERDYGIESKLSDLNIKLLGQNTITAEIMGVRILSDPQTGSNVTFLGGGSLDIKAETRGFSSTLDIFLTDGVKITSESTSNKFCGFTGSVNPLPTLTMSGEGTMLRAKGGSDGSIIKFHALNLSDGIKIIEPEGATFVEDEGIKKNGALVANEWVVIGKPARGDVNLDGTVDIADAVSVLNAMAGQTGAGDANVNGDHDANGNPVIDIADLVTVLNIMAGQ